MRGALLAAVMERQRRAERRAARARFGCLVLLSLVLCLVRRLRAARVYLLLVLCGICAGFMSACVAYVLAAVCMGDLSRPELMPAPLPPSHLVRSYG
jgi:hypothetical protein